MLDTFYIFDISNRLSRRFIYSRYSLVGQVVFHKTIMRLSVKGGPAFWMLGFLGHIANPSSPVWNLWDLNNSKPRWLIYYLFSQYSVTEIMGLLDNMDNHQWKSSSIFQCSDTIDLTLTVQDFTLKFGYDLVIQNSTTALRGLEKVCRFILT